MFCLFLRFNLAFKIFMIAGTSWILGKLSLFVPENMKFIRLFLDCLDCGSGIAIFIVLIYCRPRVKKLLANRIMFRFLMPNDWSTLEQIE